MKSQIENRLIAVTSYTGSQDLPWMIGRAMPDQKVLGSSPDWMVARACMTPEEYMAFGRDGGSWAFLKGKADLAQRMVDVVRRVVEEKCAAAGLRCNWSRLLETPEPPRRYQDAMQ